MIILIDCFDLKEMRTVVTSAAAGWTSIPNINFSFHPAAGKPCEPTTGLPTFFMPFVRKRGQADEIALVLCDTDGRCRDGGNVKKKLFLATAIVTHFFGASGECRSFSKKSCYNL
ncbi:MAG: hypothetical protein ACLVJ6_00715 [Merdibacter sp.]